MGELCLQCKRMFSWYFPDFLETISGVLEHDPLRKEWRCLQVFHLVWPISLTAAYSVGSVTRTRPGCAGMLKFISLDSFMNATTAEWRRSPALPSECTFILTTILQRVLTNNTCLLGELFEELLVQNMTKSTNQMGRTEWICNFCGKSNSDKSKIKTHVQTHLHLEHYCPHCGKPAKNPEALKTHIRTFHKMF